ncbi:rRNA maturation RNase YbeY [Candidatus Puniceispirillum sp.]|nr:rRNA maturation RNase YbeY [Candidatus Puniceispirillum sp.]
MKRRMKKGDDTLEPDSCEDDRFLSDEWLSEHGALIDITVDATSWRTSLIDDLKNRGPVMLDYVAARLSLDPQMISLLLCNDEDMRRMNNLHRGFDKATNVLSFPAGDDLQRADNMLADEITIGDIAIAGETVMCEASKAGIAVRDHVLHLFTHGVLHLLGYGHADDTAAAEMEGLEIELLAQMKIANPYCVSNLAVGTREGG